MNFVKFSEIKNHCSKPLRILALNSLKFEISENIIGMNILRICDGKLMFQTVFIHFEKKFITRPEHNFLQHLFRA